MVSGRTGLYFAFGRRHKASDYAKKCYLVLLSELSYSLVSGCKKYIGNIDDYGWLNWEGYLSAILHSELFKCPIAINKLR